jgi:hypothetical protein
MKPTDDVSQFPENGIKTPETKLTVKTTDGAYQSDSLLSFNHANREVLRITHDGRMIMGEGLSTEEATQEAAKLLIASFEEQIQKMLDARAAAELVTMNVPRREIAEADTARLDWLDENMDYSGGGSGGTYSFFTPADVECGMLRYAIDAAMTKEASK